MSWLNTNKNNNISDFLKGINIFDQLNNSVFGKIKHTLLELFGNEYANEYTLPRVIVIGNESSGKSSLLENITKCQLFPRDIKTCTKCPIHLKLSNNINNSYIVQYKNTSVQIHDKLKIYEEITKIMNLIEPNVISTDEIIINISEPNLPVFELLDLPGIISYPPENAELSLQLCKKYLADKNTIVLCVVPATTTRLTSCQSIALIKEMQMEHNSILALTMADRVHSANIGDLLINRLLKTSDELLNLNFCGYVAIVNRIHTDEYNLEENDDHEISWFNTHILDNIPQNYIYEYNMISQNVTINNLIKQLDKLYSQYIEKEWKTHIINKITSNMGQLHIEKHMLGNHINNLKYSDLNIVGILLEQIYNAYSNFCNSTLFYHVGDHNYDYEKNENTKDSVNEDKSSKKNIYNILDNVSNNSLVGDEKNHMVGFKNAYAGIDFNKSSYRMVTTYVGDVHAKYIGNNKVEHMGDVYMCSQYGKFVNHNGREYLRYDEIKNVISALSGERILNILDENCKPLIEQCFNKKIPLVLHRFSALYDRVYKYITNQCLKYWVDCEKKIKKILYYKLEFDFMKNSGICYSDEDFSQCVENILKNHIFHKLLHNFKIYIGYNDFVENESYKEQRNVINTKILHFEKHLHIISNLQI